MVGDTLDPVKRTRFAIYLISVPTGLLFQNRENHNRSAPHHERSDLLRSPEVSWLTSGIG